MRCRADAPARPKADKVKLIAAQFFKKQVCRACCALTLRRQSLRRGG
jgi:hypothetical protein